MAARIAEAGASRFQDPFIQLSVAPVGPTVNRGSGVPIGPLPRETARIDTGASAGEGPRTGEVDRHPLRPHRKPGGFGSQASIER